MRKQLANLIVAALLMPPMLAAGQELDTVSRGWRWSEDLRVLVSQLEAKHPNLYARISKQEFAEAAHRLRVAVPQRAEASMALCVMRLLASLGDGHTSVSANFQALGFHRLPLSLYWFDDGMHVRDADTSYAHLVGARVVEIAGQPVDTVVARVSAFIAHDNAAGVKNGVPGYLMIAEILRAAGITRTVDSVTIAFEKHDGLRQQITIAPRPWMTPAVWSLPGRIGTDSLPFYRRNTDRAYWFEFLEPDSTMYVAYNRAAIDPKDPIDQFAERLDQAIRERNAQRVVVDFRNNSGGNSSVFGAIQRRLLALKAERPTLELIGVIGRRTFSSGMWNALGFRRDAGATLYGEPTGGKPNHFGEVRQFTLPYSKLVVTHSTKVWRLLPNEDPPSLMPDIAVPIRAADYFANRDPVLHRIHQR